MQNDPVNEQDSHSEPPEIENPRKSTPLGALFLGVAVCAVLVSMIVPGLGEIENASISIPDLVIYLILGFGGGSLAGFSLGLFFEDRIATSLIGSLVGAVAGIVGVLMSLTDIKATNQVLMTSVIGSIVVLVCAFFLRHREKPDSQQ